MVPVACYLPCSNCGCDAHFILEEYQAFGVAEGGVDAWTNRGVDVREFSCLLMCHAMRAIHKSEIR